jgi:hypothetical protein
MAYTKSELQSKRVLELRNIAKKNKVPIRGKGKSELINDILNTRYFFNPDQPKKSFDVYLDKNPKDTIPIKYKTLQDVKDTINKLERLYQTKKYSHKRIWQVGMIMKVRLRVLQNKKPKEYTLANRYFKFLGERTKLPKEQRYKFKFRI